MVQPDYVVETILVLINVEAAYKRGMGRPEMTQLEAQQRKKMVSNKGCVHMPKSPTVMLVLCYQ